MNQLQTLLANEWLWWIAQIAVDVILLLAVFVLLAKLKKGKGVSGQAPLAAQDFVEQAGNLAREFDRLLGEKRELVGTTLATLDARISELRAMLDQAQALNQKVSAEVVTATAAKPVAAARRVLVASRAHQAAPVPENDSFDLPPGHPLHQAGVEAVGLSPEQDFRQQVIRLHGLGRNSAEIALATNRPRAEVELLLALIK